jgi:hypothetical protein
MENDIVRKTSGRRITFIVAVILISACTIYYSVMSIISPGRRLEELKNEYGIKPDERKDFNEHIYSDSAYLRLMKEKAYLQSKALMAETDSIYLTINLKDSTSNIEISGVTVHTAKISSYEISRILRRCDENILLTMLSSPFTIENSIASIKKEPVMIKMAPKDTSEYKPDIIPDTSLIEPVNYIFEMTNGTRIYVYQEENVSSDRRNNLSFDLRDRLRNAWSSLKSAAVLKVPEYRPYIKIRIPRADGKIIYRALPRNGQVAVCT